MYSLTVRIAEHDIRFLTGSEFIIQQLVFKYGATGVELPADRKPDLTIELETGYGRAFVNYDVEATIDGGTIFFRRQDYSIASDTGFRAARVRVYDGLALKHALMNLYSAFISHQEWGLLIHSSCVAEKDQAYLFAGRSGAGKSTVARLSSPREILSDEASIVKIEDDKVTVFNSPFRSDSDIPYQGGNRPLAGIHFLHQAPEDRRTRIGRTEGILEIMNKVFYWAYHPAETMKVLKMCKRLATRVPLYALYFQKQDSFWHQIAK